MKPVFWLAGVALAATAGRTQAQPTRIQLDPVVAVRDPQIIATLAGGIGTNVFAVASRGTTYIFDLDGRSVAVLAGARNISVQGVAIRDDTLALLEHGDDYALRLLSVSDRKPIGFRRIDVARGERATLLGRLPDGWAIQLAATEIADGASLAASKNPVYRLLLYPADGDSRVLATRIDSAPQFHYIRDRMPAATRTPYAGYPRFGVTLGGDIVEKSGTEHRIVRQSGDGARSPLGILPENPAWRESYTTTTRLWVESRRHEIDSTGLLAFVREQPPASGGALGLMHVSPDGSVLVERRDFDPNPVAEGDSVYLELVRPGEQGSKLAALPPFTRVLAFADSLVLTARPLRGSSPGQAREEILLLKFRP